MYTYFKKIMSTFQPTASSLLAPAKENKKKINAVAWGGAGGGGTGPPNNLANENSEQAKVLISTLW